MLKFGKKKDLDKLDLKINIIFFNLKILFHI